MTYRFGLPIALGLALVAAAPARAQDPALQDAVRSYGASVTLASDPALVQSADFDGDGREDVAAVLEGDGGSALVIFNRRGSGYEPHALYASLPDADFRLRVVPPGRHRVLGGPGTVDIRASALELVFPGRSSAMYVWGDGRYRVYGTENY